jgi:hypothetical protein
MPTRGLLLQLCRFCPVPLLGLALAGCHHRVSANEPVPSGGGVVAYDPPPRYPDIEWTSSVEEGRARSADEHKPMLLFVRAAWSKPSVDMDMTVWQDARVLAEARRFVAVRVDLTAAYDGQQVPDALKPFDVTGVPTTIVVTSRGQIVGRFGTGKARAIDVAKAMHEAD